MLKHALIATVAAATAFGTVATLSAQDMPTSAPGLLDPARVMAGSYALDATHTQVAWEVSHFGFNDYFGLFGDIIGTLQLDPADLSTAAVDITIPISSVAVSSEGLREHLTRPGKDGGEADFFGADPAAARFVSDDVRRIDANRAAIFGTLTMNGKSGPVTLITEFTGAGTNPFNKKDTVGFEATASIERSQWDINGALPLVGDTVDLRISAAFEKD